MYGLGTCETFEILKFKQSVNGFKNLATGVITCRKHEICIKVFDNTSF